MLGHGYYNMDCMDGLKLLPDKSIDLAVVDPPYGIGVKNSMGRRRGEKKDRYPKAYWDKVPPEPEYFRELFRVAKHSVIWGGNYFDLPPCRCFLVWDKPEMCEKVSFAMCEYAWTDIPGTAKIFHKCSDKKGRIHVTQKPVELYEWILRLFAEEGDVVLDTHAGSANCLIACHRTGHPFIGFEKDAYYYALSKERLEAEQAQVTMFDWITGQAMKKEEGSRE